MSARSNPLIGPVVGAMAALAGFFGGQALCNWLQTYTDHREMLLVAAVEAYALVFAIESAYSYWARTNDELVDAWERWVLQVINFVKVVVVGTITNLLFTYITIMLAVSNLRALAIAYGLVTIGLEISFIFISNSFSFVFSAVSEAPLPQKQMTPTDEIDMVSLIDSDSSSETRLDAWDDPEV